MTCVLPHEDRGVVFGGWGKAAVVYDTDGTFDIRRLHHLLKTRITAATRGVRPAESRTVSQLLKLCLSRIHIFRPGSSTQLAISLLHLEQYLATDPVMQHSELALLVIDSISAFHWEDSFTAEQFRLGGGQYPVEYYNPFAHVATALERVRSTFGPVVVLTSWILIEPSATPSDNSNDEQAQFRQHLRSFLKFQPHHKAEAVDDLPPSDDAPESFVIPSGAAAGNTPTTSTATSALSASGDPATAAQPSDDPAADDLASLPPQPLPFLAVQHRIALRPAFRPASSRDSTVVGESADEGDVPQHAQRGIQGAIRSAGSTHTTMFQLRVSDQDINA